MFGQSTLAFDLRWRRLHDAGFMRKAFGTDRLGPPEVNIDKPFAWTGGPRQKGDEPDIDPRNYLLEDFCVIDNRRFFIRGVLEFPVLDSGGSRFAFSLWVEVSALHFDRYGDTFDLPNQSEMGTFPGKIANRLSTFPDTIDIACTIYPQNDRTRPLIAIDDAAHALAAAQRRGIPFEQLLDFFAGSGIDLRAALAG